MPTTAAATASTAESLERSAEVRAGLGGSLDRTRESGFPHVPVEGKLLRPLIAYLAVPAERRGDLDQRFWSGALAIQMVHEASLLHDDILDDATERRGRETMVAEKGMARALVEGDHLLTASYRVASETGSLNFVTAFARGVERTVFGEKLQNLQAGKALSEAEYRRVVDGKSGELFGCATALWSCVSGEGSPDAARSLGVRVGRLYQRVDDFLDYCPQTQSGKAPHQDYRQKKWTWILDFAESPGFQTPVEELTARLFSPGALGESPMRKALAFLHAEADTLSADLESELGRLPELVAVIRNWTEAAPQALEKEEAAFRVEDPVPAQTDWLPYFAKNSRTFRFAARLFPPEEERLIAGVYAFCRFTDDMVDGREDLPAYQLEARLEGWRELMARAYEERASGVPLLDEVLGETATRGVPLDYAMELVEGVAMDVAPREYETLEDLQVYTYRVASVVGLWVSELFGVRDPWMLQRAEALGHAMQLTNILRDVGEDWRMGRVYLPRALMKEHGVHIDLLEAMVRGEVPPTDGYRNLLEHLMGEADRNYDLAMEAVPHLPSFFKRPVAVAARVYQGIHPRIRANGHDNLTRRAFTGLRHKLVLGGRGLWEARARRGLPNTQPAPGGKTPPVHPYGAVGESGHLGASVS
jgi:phytoene synthase